MAPHLISTMERPMPHLAMYDWQNRTDRLRDVAVTRRADACNIRNSSRQLRNEARIEGEWANYDSNASLDRRIGEVDTWREIISNAYDRLLKEIQNLDDEKKAAEVHLNEQADFLANMNKLFLDRDSRLAAEMTNDRPVSEIRNELYILENNQRLLADRIQKAWEKLSRLEVVKYKIKSELTNKIETVEIDRAQRALDRGSADKSFKPDSMRAPKSCCSYENWLDHTRNMKQITENEMAETVAIWESLFVCREKSRILFEAQKKRTDFHLRSRIFQTQQAYNELAWQQLRMREEIKNTTCEIEDLEESLRDKRSSLKLAETRLENRTMRCIPELCLDDAHRFLCSEVEKLREICLCLSNKLIEAKDNLSMLTTHVQKIDEDLEKKQHSLDADKRALEGHSNNEEIIIEKPNPSAQTDRNIELTNSKDITEKI